MFRRSSNKVNQGPLLVIILLIVSVWLFAQGGSEASLRSPAGLLLMLSLLLVLNMLLRKKTRKKPPENPSAYNTYGHLSGRSSSSRKRYTRSKPAFSRTQRTANPETWPYDGSYCVHCGQKRRGEEAICRRCHQNIDYPS